MVTYFDSQAFFIFLYDFTIFKFRTFIRRTSMRKSWWSTKKGDGEVDKERLWIETFRTKKGCVYGLGDVSPNIPFMHMV